MNKFDIEIAYATPEKQCIIKISVPPSTSIHDAILHSNILQQFPEINLAKVKVGIFSKQKALSQLVHQGDRIEIYRPLVIDPKDARRAKAKKTPKTKNVDKL